MAETSTGSAGGLLAGLLAGTALCSVLFAVMSVVTPLETSSSAIAPEISTLSDGPELTTSGANEDESPTFSQAEAPSNSIALEAPTAEVPAADRDSQTVSLERPDDRDPVQTGTAVLNGPETTINAVPETAEANLPTEVDAPKPLETAETSVGSETPEVAAAPETPKVVEQQVVAPEVLQIETPNPPQTSENEPLVALTEEPEAESLPGVATENSAAPNEHSGPKAPQAIVLDENSGTTLRTSEQPVTKTGNNGGLVLEDAPEQGRTPSFDTTPSESSIVLLDPTPELQPEPEADSEDQEIVIEPEAAPVEEDVVLNDAPAPPEFNGNAFAEFAVEYQAPDDGPLLAIILEDVGSEGVSLEDLQSFGAAVTFAVPSGLERAQWREAAFRESGFEVVVLGVGSEGPVFSQKTNEVSVPHIIEEVLNAVPGAVALIDPAGGDIYRNPRLVSTLASELGNTGRGLLFHEKFGVNRALEAANSSGIPSRSILRIIDETRDSANIRRALDRASLDASKSGAAIVYGRTYPETVATILPWMLGNSARAVNLAPLTATMRRADR